MFIRGQTLLFQGKIVVDNAATTGHHHPLRVPKSGKINQHKNNKKK